MLLSVNSITNLIPLKLDVDKANHADWCYFFKKHYEIYYVLKHIIGESTSSSTKGLPSALFTELQDNLRVRPPPALTAMGNAFIRIRL
ncbi:hypothetical protein Tco_1553031, partial [Tanacetum coccineum]